MMYTYRMNRTPDKMPGKMTQEQIATILEKAVNGASISQLAREYSCHRATIRYHLRQKGVYRSPSDQTQTQQSLRLQRQAPPVPQRKNPLPPPSINKPALPASPGSLVGAIMEAPATPLPDGPAECPPQYLRPDGTSRVVCNNCHTNAARWYRIKGQMFARDCVECATRDKAYVDSKVGP